MWAQVTSRVTPRRHAHTRSRSRLTVHIVHRPRAGVAAADGVRPRRDGSEVAARLRREDMAQRLLHLGVEVDLGDSRDDFVAWASARSRNLSCSRRVETRAQPMSVPLHPFQKQGAHDTRAQEEQKSFRRWVRLGPAPHSPRSRSGYSPAAPHASAVGTAAAAARATAVVFMLVVKSVGSRWSSWGVLCG